MESVKQTIERTRLPHIRLIAMGSIECSDLAAYADTGAYGFGIGQNIVNKALIEAGDYKAVAELAREQAEMLRSIFQIA